MGTQLLRRGHPYHPESMAQTGSAHGAHAPVRGPPPAVSHTALPSPALVVLSNDAWAPQEPRSHRSVTLEPLAEFLAALGVGAIRATVRRYFLVLEILVLIGAVLFNDGANDVGAVKKVE
uniref:Uncharacterized protein n=1 Tax=Oryza brachyantha TaxID=4533 RepID=J3M0G7_ORYBR